jgi:hypothetical protein
MNPLDGNNKYTQENAPAVNSVGFFVAVAGAAALPTYTPPASLSAVATVSEPPSTGVVVECVRTGGKLRVHVVSNGFEPSWNVQFPRGIRGAGARYVVDALHPAQGGFHRVRGEIRRLV